MPDWTTRHGRRRIVVGLTIAKLLASVAAYGLYWLLTACV